MTVAYGIKISGSRKNDRWKHWHNLKLCPVHIIKIITILLLCYQTNILRTTQ